MFKISRSESSIKIMFFAERAHDTSSILLVRSPRIQSAETLAPFYSGTLATPMRPPLKIFFVHLPKSDRFMVPDKINSLLANELFVFVSINFQLKQKLEWT